MPAARIELNTRSADAIDGRQLRAVAFLGVRLEYVTQVLRRLPLASVGGEALVVGSGRGDLARGLATLGLEVTAVDPSAAATEMAREASARAGLAVTHETAEPEHLGHASGRFDVAYYADTFETTSQLDQVLKHAGRVLRPGGVLFYDTVNRTLLGRLVYLGAFQGLPMTRIMPRGRYAAQRLRRPAEVVEALAAHGLRNQEIRGFKPKNPPDLIRAILARRRAEISDDEVGRLVEFILEGTGRPQVTYLGYALRA